MKILRAADYQIMPWKNGLGSTIEIAISPGAKGLNEFDWRVSMARVASDGPFSRFPGIDRTLLVLEGDGMILAGAHRPPVRLQQNSDPYAFPGDEATDATLISGPIHDLNIMSRREAFQHTVSRFDLKGRSVVPERSSLQIVFVENGALRVHSGEGTIEAVGRHDAVLFESETIVITADSDVPARLVMIAFS